MRDTFMVDNRSDVIKVDFFDIDDNDKEIVLTVADNTKFIPTVTYARDERVEDEMKPSGIIATIVRISSGSDVIAYEMFTKVAQPIHNNFRGLREYIDSDIIINADCKKEVFVGFCNNCRYYPVIGVVYRG